MSSQRKENASHPTLILACQNEVLQVEARIGNIEKEDEGKEEEDEKEEEEEQKEQEEQEEKEKDGERIKNQGGKRKEGRERYKIRPGTRLTEQTRADQI